MTRRLKRAVQRYLGKHFVNRITVPLIQAGVSVPGLWSTQSTLVMEHFGRKSSRRYLTPAGYARVSNDLVRLVAEHGERSDWVRNVLETGTVRVWIDGEVRRGRPVLRPDLEVEEVFGAMKGSLVRLGARALMHDPKVVEIALER